jgi:drug/metabolite transporter (DMT)-like permease
MASVTWAFASIRYAAVAREVGDARVGLLRAVSATVMWWAVALATSGSPSEAVDLRHGAFLVGSIVCSYALGDRVFFAAAHRVGVSTALAIATIYPLWAALYGTLFRGEPFGLRRSLGVLACLIGVSALLALSRAGNVSTAQRANGSASATSNAQVYALGGVGLALLTSLFWAGNAVFLKLGTDGPDIVQANAIRFTAGVVLLALQLPRRQSPAAATSVRYTSLARRLALPLLVDTGLGSICFVYGIAHTDLALGATLSSLSPLVALPLAVMLGTERFSPGRALAVCLTLTGVLLLVTATSG